jgi:hypothetical protein
MKSIKRLFEKVAREHPNWGSVIVFNHIVGGKNFSHDRIARWFNILVDKEEYDRSDKKEILNYIYLLNTPLNRTKNEGITPPRAEKKVKMGKDEVGSKLVLTIKANDLSRRS